MVETTNEEYAIAMSEWIGHDLTNWRAAHIQTGSVGPVTTSYYHALAIMVYQYSVRDAYKACTVSLSDTVRRVSSDTHHHSTGLQ